MKRDVADLLVMLAVLPPVVAVLGLAIGAWFGRRP